MNIESKRLRREPDELIAQHSPFEPRSLFEPAIMDGKRRVAFSFLERQKKLASASRLR